MNRRMGILVTIMTIIFMASTTSAQTVNLTNNTSLKDHNFAIIRFMVNGTAGTLNARFATIEEPLIIIGDNQTVSISLREWGIDTCRNGVILTVSNDTGPGTTEYLMPLERGWGTQTDEVSFGNIKVQIGMTEIFRGRTKEYVKFCVVIIKLPKK